MSKDIFILTDGCMWEARKQSDKSYPHAIEVVDAETGQVRYIRSGSRIKFIDGQITVARNQEDYNNDTRRNK